MTHPDLDYRFSPRKKHTTTRETPVVTANGTPGDGTNNTTASHDIFWCNSQQGFAISSIEAIDDFGGDISVTLKTGRKMTVDSPDRDRFFARIPALPSWNR